MGAFTYELRFPGQFFDQPTYLHYNYFRDYDPRLGRYMYRPAKLDS
jgi:RHS repeat-associated protein